MSDRGGASGADPRIGMTLDDRYRIVSRVAAGGMATVYAAEHLRVRRRVAIKVLHAQFAQKPDVVARFHREAEAAGAIGHPNIVDVLDMGTLPDGTPFLVLELLEGSDLGSHVAAHGPLALGQVVHVVTQACDALAAVHERGIVHRDIKPENLFLTRRGDDPAFVKVLDFGVSKILIGHDAGLTKTGTAVGTPYYMAPEQSAGAKDVDLRCDIYALGVVMFRALTGQYPIDDDSYPMLVLKICTQAPPPLLAFRADLPEEVDRVVQRMMAKDPRHRYPSCREVREALLPFRGASAPPVLRPDAPRTADIPISTSAFDVGIREVGTTLDVPELAQLDAWRAEAEARGVSDPEPASSAPEHSPAPVPDTAWLSADQLDAALRQGRAHAPASSGASSRSPDMASPSRARWLLPLLLGSGMLALALGVLAVALYLASAVR